MPILNYSCEQCGKQFAKIFFSAENAATRCPVCDSEKIIEGGDAFNVDPSSFARLVSGSCESCESCDSCGSSPAQSTRSS